MAREQRTRRNSINGTRNRLSVRGQDPNFHYRVVNDVDDRIQTLQEIGYEVVSDTNVSVGDKRITATSQEGSPVKISVGLGTQAYLMKQKKEFFEEDQALKENRLQELDDQMRDAGKQAGNYGSISITRD